jgi:methylmalonic aciduria homocystinuria type C protein
MAAARVMAAIRPFLNGAGFDLVHASTVGVYNSMEGIPNTLPEMSAGSSTLAVIIGNSKHLWPKLVRAHAMSESIQKCPHPLDLGYTKPALTKLFNGVLPAKLDGEAPATHIRFAHEVASDRVVAVARFAHDAGMAYLCQQAYLSVHPVYGPWMSFRAVAVIDVDGSEVVDEKGPPSSPFSTDQAAAIAELMTTAVASTAGKRPTASESPCPAAAASAATDATAAASMDRLQLTPVSEAFLAVRDACGQGFEQHRFSKEQLSFHYDHNRDALTAGSE